MFWLFVVAVSALRWEPQRMVFLTDLYKDFQHAALHQNFTEELSQKTMTIPQAWFGPSYENLTMKQIQWMFSSDVISLPSTYSQTLNW